MRFKIGSRLKTIIALFGLVMVVTMMVVTKVMMMVLMAKTGSLPETNAKSERFVVVEFNLLPKRSNVLFPQSQIKPPIPQPNQPLPKT